MLFASVILAATMAAAPASSSNTAYVQQINQWHADRVKRLRSPDDWLSLIALRWLQPGANTVGSAADNDAVLPKGPAHLGVVTWHKDGAVSIHLADAVDARINGKQVRQAALLDDSHDQPTRVSFGSVDFYLIARGPKKGLRVKDTQAPTRTGFTHIDRYPVDKSWRVEAKFIPFKPMHHMKVATVIGTLSSYPVPGKLIFRRDGKTYTLLPVIEVPGDTQLFIEFADRTNGKSTYGGGRTLYIDMPRNGEAVIDFNKAYNPPCVFTPYATCDLPPPENRLDMSVTAGEKMYHGPGK